MYAIRSYYEQILHKFQFILHDMYRHFFKRVIDLFFSILGLLFLSLIFIPIVILIKLEDKGPIFYSGFARLGRESENIVIIRITSYNVCYTKLLRMKSSGP